MRGRFSTAVGAGLAAVSSFSAAAAVARIATQPGPTLAAAARERPHDDAPVAGQGPAGSRGLTGAPGERGPTGPAGTAQELVQTPTVNWEGGFANSVGRDTAGFVVPGIGTGTITCSQDTQWVHFVPYDQNTDVAMWTAKFQGADTTVRTAHHTTYTGSTFNEGLDHYAGEPTSEGSMIGIISSAGSRLGGSNGAGPPPTTFHLSWQWNFTDPNNPYCFMAATVVSNGG